jgi:cysteine-rich secretory family protein
MLTDHILSNRKLKLILLLCIALSMMLLSVQLFPLVHADVQTDFIATLNAERVSLGLNPLTINQELENAAYLHSQDMAINNYFDHTTPNGTAFVQRIEAAGYTNWVSLAENIAEAYGSSDAAEVYTLWKNSPGHWANMIGDYTEAGLGAYTQNGYTYYTLDLGKSTYAEPTQTPPPIPTSTPIQIPTATPTPTLSTTPTPPSATPIATPMPTPASTASPTTSPSATPTPLPTPIPTAIPTPIPSQTTITLNDTLGPSPTSMGESTPTSVPSLSLPPTQTPNTNPFPSATQLSTSSHPSNSPLETNSGKTLEHEIVGGIIAAIAALSFGMFLLWNKTKN